jgi:hypothetical protein
MQLKNHVIFYTFITIEVVRSLKHNGKWMIISVLDV